MAAFGSPLLLFLPVSLLVGLALVVMAILRWRSSRKIAAWCLLGAIFFQLWWGVPAVWWASQNFRMYTEFHLKKNF